VSWYRNWVRTLTKRAAAPWLNSSLPAPKRLAGQWIWTLPRLLNTDPPEVHIIIWIKQHLRPGAIFFDVGAHYGWMSIIACDRVGSGGRVIAFEPSPPLVEILLFHKRANALRQLEIVAKAVSDINASVPFYLIHQGLSFRNSLTIGPDDTPYIKPEEKLVYEAASITLDHYYRDYGAIPDLVKIDVEGAELLVLRGAEELLKRHHPRLIVGIHPYWLPKGQSAGQILTLLEQFGYAIEEEHTVSFSGGVLSDYLFA
jgi:FkbM family methyltransferase